MWTVFGGGHRLAAKPRMIVGASTGAKKNPGRITGPGMNPPQGGILAVGAGERRFVPDDKDNPVVQTIMSCTLSVDHRVVDGAVGAAFLQAFKANLEDPLCLLLS